MKRIRYELTAEDSEQGKRSTIYKCPFARAIKRLFGIESEHGVIVADVAYVRDDEGVARQFRMSRNSKEKIYRYDKKGIPIKPGVYEMYPINGVPHIFDQHKEGGPQ